MAGRSPRRDPPPSSRGYGGSDPVLARHVANLSLISGPSGLRPDLDVTQGQPIAAALGAMIAFDGVTRIEPVGSMNIILPTGVVG